MRHLPRATFVLALLVAACTPTVRPAGVIDVGPRADANVDAFRPSDAGSDANVDANVDAFVGTDSGSGFPPGALEGWTLADVIADARPRVPASDARLVLVSASDVRVDGTIDLTTRTSSTTVSGHWTLDFQSLSQMRTWSYEYGRYDPGTAWPAVTMRSYVEAATIDAPPDSPAVLAAFLAEPTCHAAPDGLTDFDLYQSVGVGVGGLGVRVSTSDQTARFWYIGMAFGTDQPCS